MTDNRCVLPESWQDLINCTLGRKIPRLDVRSQPHITLPQTKGEYTEYSERQRQPRTFSEWGIFILRHKVINFIWMLGVLQLYYDNPNMSFFCLSENYKNSPFHLKTRFLWNPTYVFRPSILNYFQILSLTKQWLSAIVVFHLWDSRQA